MRPALRTVAVGGGTGLPAVLRAFRLILGDDAPADSLTAIVTVTDDGGSSGRLREELRVPPPGDIRNCVAALAPAHSPLASLLQHRFEGESGIGGHAVGNLLLAGLTQQMNGDFAAAVDAFSRMVGIGGRVLPATNDEGRLKAEYLCGEIAVGETAIVKRGLPIRRLSFERPLRPVPEAIAALINADVIVVGPGSLYTSILPVLLVNGIASTISGLLATRIYVANLMTEPGETDGYSLDDHLAVIRDHTGFDLFDYVLVNNHPLDPALVAHYGRQGSWPVRCNRSIYASGADVIGCDLTPQRTEGKIRHDPRRLAAAMQELLNRRAAAAERLDTAV